MKMIPNLTFKWTKKRVLLLVLVLSTLSTILTVKAVQSVNDWFNGHYLQFNPIVEVNFNRPVEVKERKLEVTQVVQVLNELEPLENLSPIEAYICEKWGPYDCKTALAVARAESGMREDAFGINSNNTIDVGIFQINSVHFSKDGCALKDVVDPYKNVDCAYQIWEASGWNPWVVFQTGAFKNKLD